jgi:hypothetical protein
MYYILIIAILHKKDNSFYIKKYVKMTFEVCKNPTKI